MIETLTNVQWFAISIAALSIGMSKTGVQGMLKVPLQAFVWDNITWNSFFLNLTMLPVIGVGALIGIRIVKLLPEKVFRRFIQVVTVISVLMMIL